MALPFEPLFYCNSLIFNQIMSNIMTIIDGKKLSDLLKTEIAAEVEKIKASGGKIPHLAAVLVGDDPASQVYVRNKVKSCEDVGFNSTLVRRPADATEEELLEVVNHLNNDDDIDGFIVQLPLPKHINEENVTLAIDPKKDVDGFHPVNFGRMALGLPSYLPATPFGIMTMLERYHVPTAGKNAVVIGRSNIVGTPMAILLSRKGSPGDCTVTLVHSRTKNMKEIVAQADIIVAAIGRPEFVTADMVKEGAVVIDVGINRIDDPSHPKGSRLVGDVAYSEVAPKCSFITPVPGGVGPMTVMSLIINTLKASRKEIYG
jgi:methylenetetrahydrofolate dehydrogenase (NADP+)/methenyltetrahydrofolate cyclohydrolase